MSANSFKADKFVRIVFPNHGLTITEVGLKLVLHEDGTQVGITREEWQKMRPPLLVKLDGGWTLGGLPVEITETKGKRSH